MATYRRGAVTIRISEKDMQQAMSEVAGRSAGGAAHFLAQLSQKYIEQNNLIDKGRLKDSITTSRGGALKGQGVIWRVTSLARIAPHNNIIHGGRGPIRSNRFMYLTKRRNDSRKTNLVRRTHQVRGVRAFPFLAAPAQALRERHFAYAVQAAKPLGGKPKGQTVSKGAGGFTKAMQSGVLKGGRY